MTESYRSYVVRVRRRRDPGGVVRLDVEDLLGGRRATLSGAAANGLADDLEQLVGSEPAPDALPPAPEALPLVPPVAEPPAVVSGRPDAADGGA